MNETLTNAEFTAIQLIQALDLYITVNTDTTEATKILIIKLAQLVANKHKILIA